MALSIVYRDALNSSTIYPYITNDQNNSVRSNNSVTMDDDRQYISSIILVFKIPQFIYNSKWERWRY